MSKFKWWTVDDVRDSFHQLQRGLSRVAQFDKTGWELKHVFRELMDGTALACVASPTSFFIFKRFQNQYTGDATLLVWMAYQEKPEVTHEEAVACIDAVAKAHGCELVDFRSPRAGWDRLAEALGFECTDSSKCFTRKVA